MATLGLQLPGQKLKDHFLRPPSELILVLTARLCNPPDRHLLRRPAGHRRRS